MYSNQDAYRPITSHLKHSVRRQLKISWIEYILLDTVYHLSAKDGYCYASHTHLGAVLGISRQGYMRLRTRLIERELLVEVAKGMTTAQSFNEIAYLEKYDEVIETQQSYKTQQSLHSRGGGATKLPKTQQSTGNIYNYNKKLPKKTWQETFGKINEALQTTAKYSDAYGRIIGKALETFTEDELIQSAKYFRHKFHGGSAWHTENPKFFNMKQFLGNDKDRIPRYQSCLEESLSYIPAAPVYANGNYGPNANPDIDKYFPRPQL